MSGGGRHGFDAPYRSSGCYYRWYSAPEICMILERFDGVVFIGDEMLKIIYAAFNMLIREDIATGGMKQWEFEDAEQQLCKCENQLMKSKCLHRLILDSEAVRLNADKNDGKKAAYFCNRES